MGRQIYVVKLAKASATWLAALALGLVDAQAVELSVQPRLESGFAYYELEQGPLTSPNGIQRISSVTSSDVMPFIGGGFAMFADRFYLDVSAQHYFNGNDRASASSTNINPAGVVPFVNEDTVTENLARQDNDFQRTDWSLAIGYNVTDYWSVYVGYKNTSTRFDERLSGQIATAAVSNRSVPLSSLSGDYVADARLAFDYDGPFIGTNLTWPINHGWLNGALSGNFGIAFMDGRSRLDVRDFVLTNRNGQKIPVDVNVPGSPTLGLPFDGDTVGVNFGVSWRGYTGLEGLTYVVGISGYRYEFENSSQSSFDLNETLIRFNFNAGYTFDF